MASNFIPTFDYVPDGTSVSHEEQVRLVSLMESVKEQVNDFGKLHIEGHKVMPDNTPWEECIGEGKPMITYTEIDWAHMTQEDRESYMEESGDATEPSEDFRTVRVTLNDGYFAPFVEETFPELSQEDRYKMALFLRHNLFSYAQHMVMPIMIKHKLGVVINALADGDDLDAEPLDAEGTESED